MDIRVTYFGGGIVLEEEYYEICFFDSKAGNSLLVALVRFDNSIMEFLRYLSNDEHDLYSKLKVDSRREQFVAGRYAAKQCIRRAFPSYDPESINIAYGAWGFPLIQAEGLYQTSISIAHTDHYAASLLSLTNTHPIGIDLEEIDEDHNKALDRFISAKEQSMVKDFDGRKTELLHLLWSSKEAAGKALKIGFNAPEDIYSISEVGIEKGFFHVSFDQLPQMKVVGWIQDGHILCIAFPSVWNFKTLKKPDTYEEENFS